MVTPADFLAQRKDGSWQLNIYISSDNAQAVADALATITRDYVLKNGTSLAKSQAVINAILGYAESIKVQSRSKQGGIDDVISYEE